MSREPYSSVIAKVGEGEMTYPRFIKLEFKTFFKNAAEFLSQPAQNIRTGLFSSKAKFITTFLEKSQAIIDYSSADDYSQDMVPSITDFFTVVLHPKNAQVYRQRGMEMYVKLTEILRDRAEEFTKGFERLVFDFPNFSPEAKQDRRIQVDPGQGTRTDYISPIQWFLGLWVRKLNDMADFLFWWRIVQRLIVSVLYGDVSRRLNLPDCSRSYSSPCPADLHEIMIEHLKRVLAVDEALFDMLRCENTPHYLFEILSQCARAAGNPSNAEFVKLFVNRMIESKEVVSFLNEYFESLNEVAVKALLDWMGIEFDAAEKRGKKGAAVHEEEGLRDVSRLLSATFNVLHDAYSLESKKKLCRQLAVVGGRGVPFVLHVQTLLVSGCINCQMVDPELWQIVTTGQSISPQLILSLYSYIMALYSVCIARTLLDFDIAQVKSAIADVSEKDQWTLDRSALTRDLQNWASPLQFFKDHKADFVLPEIAEERPLEGVKLQNLNVQKWSFEKALENTRAIRNAFDWSLVSDNHDLQYRSYLVNASFIHPLLKIAKAFPETLKHNRSFLASEFLPWLRKCVAPSVKNNKIVVHALWLMGEIICRDSVVDILSKEALCDWYLTLKYHMNSEDNAIKQSAITLACRSVLLDLSWSHLLLKSISDHFEWSSRDNGTGVRLSPSEAAASLLALNVTADLKPDVYFEDVSLNTDVKVKAVKCIQEVEVLKLTTWIAVLVEEAMAGRDLVIDFVIDRLIESMKTQLTIEDVYVLCPLCLILPEIEKTKNGSIAKILAAVLDIVETVRLEESVFVLFVALAVDMLIYSSYLIDCSEFFGRFEKAVDGWLLDSEECIFQQSTVQHLRFIVMSLACNYLRYPFPRVGFCGADSEGAIFGTSKTHVMKITNDAMFSATPIGRFGWRYKSIAPDPSPISLSEDTKINEEVRPIPEYTQQKEFSSKLSNYFQDLYENQLKDFEVDAELCNPGDFDAKNFVKLTPNAAVDASPQLLPTSSVGTPAVSFASSLSYFDVLDTPRLSAVVPEEKADVDKRTFAETTVYRHQIHVSILRNALDADPHFTDFLSGLGFGASADQTILHVDSNHDIFFHFDGSHEVLIVWTNGLNRDESLRSYSDKTYMRIEISPRQSGLYSVTVRVNGSQSPGIPWFSPVITTKRALPIAVIVQLLIGVHILDRKMGRVQSPFLVNGALLNAVRDTSFVPHSLTLLSPKSIFEAE